MVVLDEARATTSMPRMRGRTPRGERQVCSVPHGHWHTTTVLAGLRNLGLVAPLVLDGAINGVAFLAYTEQFLVPVLMPGDIAVLVNLSSHKVSGVGEAIELAFSKLKRHLRDAAERNVEELWQTIVRLLGRFNPTECADYIRHCDFAQSKR